MQHGGQVAELRLTPPQGSKLPELRIIPAFVTSRTIDASWLEPTFDPSFAVVRFHIPATDHIQRKEKKD
jgi:hypothetical protein